MVSIFDNLEQYKERIAIITELGEKITYEQLLQDSNFVVNQITSRSLVFIKCNNCYESVCAYIACLRKKIVPVLIASSITEDLYDKLFNKYKPSFVIEPSSRANNSNVVECFRAYSVVKTEHTIDYVLGEELALLLTTSGSTGSPKLVRQSYNNMISNAKAITEYLGINMEDRAITTMPMSYTYGLSIINSHLYVGAGIILNDYTLLNKEFWELMNRERATTFGGVPYIYEILKKLRFERMNLPSLRYLTQAGGKLSKELALEFAEICENKGIQLIIMYGQTEATARMAYLPWKVSKEKVGSMGIAIPGGRFSLVDEGDKLIEEAEVVGELIYQGNNVTLGYAESCYDLAKEDENKGILHTGDMAKRDAEGYYYIVGRKKRFLKIYGNRINLDEVESILNAKGYECVCSGVDDKLRIYTVQEDAQSEIINFISKETGINPQGFEVKLINEIPRNEAGKVLYSSLI